MRNTETLVGFACWSLFCVWVGMLAPGNEVTTRCDPMLEDGRRIVRTGPGPDDCLYERKALELSPVEHGRAKRAQERMTAIKERKRT